MSNAYVNNGTGGGGGSGTVTDVTGTLPIVITGSPTTTPNVTINPATYTTLGAASFNITEFTVTDGAVSLIVEPALTGIIPQFQADGTTAGTAITATQPNIFGIKAKSAQVTDTINSTSSASGTLEVEDRTYVSPYVVDASTTPGLRGTYSTVTSAIAAAVTDGASVTTPLNIYIRPGTYTENFTLAPGVNLVGLVDPGTVAGPVIISGTLTYTGVGLAKLSNITLQTNNAAAISITGSNACRLDLANCFLNCINGNGISLNNAVAQVNLFYCDGDIGAMGITFFVVTNGFIIADFCNFTNSGGSTDASSFANGSAIGMTSTVLAVPITTSGSASVGSGCGVLNTIDLSGTGDNTFFASQIGQLQINVGASANVQFCTTDFTGTDAVTGAGNLDYSPIIFQGGATAVNVTTQTPYQMGPISYTMGFAGNYHQVTGTTYQVLITDNVVGVNHAGAVTVTMPNTNMVAGQQWRIKDESALAGTNNITISGNGANIIGSTSASTYVINTNGGSADLYWNGTAFGVV